VTTASIARPTPDAQRRPTRHRRTRHTSPHALQLRHVWRPRLGPVARIGAAAENYVMHAVLWVALIGLLGFALVLDAHAAAYGAAALTGFFRRRPVEESIAVPGGVLRVEGGPDAAAAVARAMRPDRPLVVDDPLDDPLVPLVDDGLDVPQLAGDDDPPPPERTDVIPAVRVPRELRERSTPDVATLMGRTADLEAALVERDRVIERGTEQNRELAERLRVAELDRAEADQSAAALRRALDQHYPAPDVRELADRLKAVWLIPTSGGANTELRWRRVAQAAIDVVRGMWPIERWPLSETERTAEREQNHPADGWPHTLPGGGAEAADSAPAAAPPAPGDSTAAGHVEPLARALAACDYELQVAARPWESMTKSMREYYLTVAEAVVAAGWRPPLDRELVPRGRRAAFARVLTDHEQRADGTCRCGWGLPIDPNRGPRSAQHPMWHAEHAAAQLLALGVAR